MQSVVYADILIFINTIITFMILLTTADFVKIESQKIRYITGSVVGGVFSLIILAPSMNLLLIFLSRALICILIVLISFNIRNLKILAKCVIGFVIITFLYSGILYFIFSFIKSDRIYLNNGYIYFDLSAITVIVITALAFLTIRILNRFILKKQNTDLIFDVNISFNDKNIDIKAFFDTGNSIKDNFTGQPVIIISVNEIYSLLDNDVVEAIKTVLLNENYSQLPRKLRLLPVRTLGDYNMLPAFTADKAVITDDTTRKIIDKPSIAVCADLFSDKEYKALINKDVLGRVI